LSVAIEGGTEGKGWSIRRGHQEWPILHLKTPLGHFDAFSGSFDVLPSSSREQGGDQSEEQGACPYKSLTGIYVSAPVEPEEGKIHC
jgi:hypothetical protein